MLKVEKTEKWKNTVMSTRITQLFVLLHFFDCYHNHSASDDTYHIPEEKKVKRIKLKNKNKRNEISDSVHNQMNRFQNK